MTKKNLERRKWFVKIGKHEYPIVARVPVTREEAIEMFKKEYPKLVKIRWPDGKTGVPGSWKKTERKHYDVEPGDM